MATLSFKILPTRRKSSGKLGIYISLTFKKEVRYISTEFEVDDEFQFENGKVCYRKDAAILNKRMQYVLNEYKEKLESLNQAKYYTCSQLKKALITDNNTLDTSITISEMFKNRIERLKAEGRNSYADMNRYTCIVITSIIKDMPVSYLTRNDIKVLFNNMKKKGFANGNIQMRMTHFKAAINELIDEGVCKFEDHPFKGFKMPQAEIRMMDITRTQFRRIAGIHETDRRLQLARDMFLLSFYLGGINLADLVKADLSGKSIIYIRSKSAQHKVGEKRTAITITKEAKEIINRYIGKDGKLNILQGTNYNNFRRYLNKCFKDLADRIGIHSVVFSFYSARKTFAQYAFEIGIRTEVIEYCIGQSMKANRPIYNYVRVMQRKADEAIRQVIDYAINSDLADSRIVNAG